MLLPLFAWTAICVFCHIKLSYPADYKKIRIKTYPLQSNITLPVNQHWYEARIFRTILGEHLLVKTGANWQHLDPITLKKKPKPDAQTLIDLLQDAIAFNSLRYERVHHKNDNIFITNTQITLTVDWNTMTIQQYKQDSHLMNALHKTHHLQWSGIQALDRFLGIIGLALLTLLAVFGGTLYARGKIMRA